MSLTIALPLAADPTDVVRVAEAAGPSAAVIVAGLTVFALACFVGFEIITKVPPTLHTPLMSGSNAISGITVCGALLATGSDAGLLAKTLGFVAIVAATVNVVGGFLVTHRMLAMFKRKKAITASET